MPLFQKNVDLHKAKKVTSWRKISIGSWKNICEATINAQLEVNAEPVLEHLAKINENSKKKIHFRIYFANALAKAMAKHPQINSILRFGKIYQRKEVDLSFLVANNLHEGDELTAFVIRNVDNKSLQRINLEFSKAVKAIKLDTDKGFKKIKKIFGMTPGFLSKYILNFNSFLHYTLNIWSPILGTPRDPFGSAIITDIGSFGADNAFAPIAPYTRVPFVVSLGSIKERPFVVDGKLEVKKTIKIGIMCDHRICDGIQLCNVMNELERLIHFPEDAVDKVSDDAQTLRESAPTNQRLPAEEVSQ